jgi:hypothetical protein
MITFTHVCVRCGGPQEMAMHEITTLSEAEPRYIAGAPEPCPACGSLATPIRVQPAPAMALAPYGPAVPTPDDLLRGAGQYRCGGPLAYAHPCGHCETPSVCLLL